MLADEYLGFKRSLDERGIVFSFTGFLSEGVLTSLGEALKQKMALADTDANLTRRVFSVFVEQVQNIIRYSAEQVRGELDRPVRLSSGMIAVGVEQGHFFVVCGNAVAATEVPRLRRRLEELQTMDREAIRAYYRRKLREPPDEDSEGGTLGLIEIARRASEPLQFAFRELDAGRSFFCLKVFI